VSASKKTTEGLNRLREAVPEPARRLARAVADAGGRAFLVGGEVRDALLGRVGKDFDIEVFGMAVDDLEALLRSLGRVNAVGKSFGVLKWRPRRYRGDEFDVSVPRRDSKVGPGHRGIAVQGDPDMSVREAARRRDLTVNAILYDLLDDALVDPFDGRADLEAGVLRAVDVDTFLEDPLRALRVVQFAARLRFEVPDELVALCRRARLDELPAERVQGEWEKLLLKSGAPSVGMAVARRARILQRVFPEVCELRSDAVLDALVAPRDALDHRGRAWALMLSGWLHGADASAVESTLDRLWVHRIAGYDVRKAVLATTAASRVPLTTDRDLRRASVAAPLGLLLPLRQALGDTTVAAHAAAFATCHDLLWSKPAPLLQGRHLGALGIPPGRHMGVLLQQVYEAQLDGEVHNEEEARSLAARLWSERG
jgi:tRNA nucleotidyltransferase (CCA-adding enzyme)